MPLSDFDKILNNIEEVLRTATGRRILKKIGELAVDIIYKRVKAGGGVNSDEATNPSRVKLKALTAAYRLRRKAVNLGKFGTPAKSNLTLTGQMLDAMTFKVEARRVKIFIKNNRRSPIGREKKVPTNRQVADWVSKERPFLALTTKEQRVIEKELRTLVRNALRNI